MIDTILDAIFTVAEVVAGHLAFAFGHPHVFIIGTYIASVTTLVCFVILAWHDRG